MTEKKSVRIVTSVELGNMGRIQDKMKMVIGKKFKDINVSDVERSLMKT